VGHRPVVLESQCEKQAITRTQVGECLRQCGCERARSCLCTWSPSAVSGAVSAVSAASTVRSRNSAQIPNWN